MGREFPELPVVAVGVVLLDDAAERVLLVRRARPPGVGKWTVPGGGVHLGETLRAAAARELLEETGLEADLGGIVEVLERVTDEGERVRFHYVIVDFVGTRPRGELAAASDASDAAWFTIDELARIETTDGLRPVIERAVALLLRPELAPYEVSDVTPAATAAPRLPSR